MNKEPQCIKCKHFYVTYEKTHPRGCRVFEVKSKLMPSKAVYKSTGSHCPVFMQRKPIGKP